MSQALERILSDFLAFREGIERCRGARVFNAADVKDAYNRLNRLRDRYKHEKDNRSLEAGEEQAFRKVFEEDHFIKGMLHGRQIGEHVQINEPVIRLYTNSPLPLCAETSAGSFFAGPIASVRDVEGGIHRIDHLLQLEEAEKRIQLSLARVSNSLP